MMEKIVLAGIKLGLIRDAVERKQLHDAELHLLQLQLDLERLTKDVQQAKGALA